jgi:DNA-binding response OmpR family regulator
MTIKKETIKKVFILDDDPFLLSLCSKKFQDQGFEVCSAMNVDDSIKVINENSPDVLLIDILLPQSSGFECISQIRMGEKGQHVPIVVFSNKDIIEKERHTLKDFNVRDFLIKSDYLPSEIVEKVIDILDAA